MEDGTSEPTSQPTHSDNQVAQFSIGKMLAWTGVVAGGFTVVTASVSAAGHDLGIFVAAFNLSFYLMLVCGLWMLIQWAVNRATGKQATGKQAAVNQETVNQETVNQETGNQETGNQETGNQETGNRETPVVAEAWSDRTGKFQVEAEFVDIDGTSVILRKANGSVLTVPLTRLSAESRAVTEKLNPRKQETGNQDSKSYEVWIPAGLSVLAPVIFVLGTLIFPHRPGNIGNDPLEQLSGLTLFLGLPYGVGLLVLICRRTVRRGFSLSLLVFYFGCWLWWTMCSFFVYLGSSGALI